jgi:hypothetical protein
MEECRKQCKTIPETILCPNGMRKENGICIKQRCSSGTRKNKHTDECEPPHKQTRNECMQLCVNLKPSPLKITKLHKITIAPKLTLAKGTLKKKDPTKMPLSPKGTLKKKDPTKMPLSQKETLKNKTPTTPRSKYIEDLPVPHLLGGVDIFQVSFQSVEQFNSYVKITENTRIECFIQCLFLLGLRDIKEAKKDIQKLKSYKNGVKYTIAATYIQTVFGLKYGMISHHNIKSIHALNLTNNYATILNVIFKDETEWGHYIVAYKYNNIVYYFDPQANNHIVIDKLKNIIGFGFFLTKGIKDNVNLKNTTSTINFYG